MQLDNRIRVGIFRKKCISRNKEQTQLTVLSVKIPSVSPEKEVPFRTIPRKRREERSEFQSEPFAEEKNPRYSVPNLRRKRKILGISFRTSHIREKPSACRGYGRACKGRKSDCRVRLQDHLYKYNTNRPGAPLLKGPAHEMIKNVRKGALTRAQTEESEAVRGAGR